MSNLKEKKRLEKRREARNLEKDEKDALELAEKMGLDPYETRFWIVDYEDINKLASYGGFQNRYPHWRWGMQYDRQKKKNQYTPSRIYELVINDDPAHAYLQLSNTSADQKAVITHVYGHTDFFKNNKWFKRYTEDFDASQVLERHSDRIEEIMEDAEISREEVESWIDNCICIEDNIDQYSNFVKEDREEKDTDELSEAIEDIDISDEVRDEIFDEEWLEEQESDADIEKPEKDILYFLREHGKQYNDDREISEEFEDWQYDIIEMMRREAYYFAPQKMTKVMNEGWAAHVESIMMASENFASNNEFIEYSDHMAKVLGAQGMNPYKIGLELWSYVENKTNRQEVIEKLLRVEDINPDNFFSKVNFDKVISLIEDDTVIDSIDADNLEELKSVDDELLDSENLDRVLSGDMSDEEINENPWKLLSYEGMCKRHFSLTRPQNKRFLHRISLEDIKDIDRYLFDVDRYSSIEEAINDIDYASAWDRMREIRSTHNDVTFIDEYLDSGFVEEQNYFAYEYSKTTQMYHATSRDYEEIKKKLLLKFTNFGKPTIKVETGNYKNKGELLLRHEYNGVVLDIDEAKRTMERIHRMWGRPINLKTIIKTVDESTVDMARNQNIEPEFSEEGLLLTYIGKSFEKTKLDWEDVEDLAADDIDYSTKPEEWL